MPEPTSSLKQEFPKSLEETSKSLPKEIELSKGYKCHQVIRDKIGYLFFNMASLCTDPPCKLHEKVTFLNLSLKSDPKNLNLSEELKKIAKRAYLVGQISLLAPISVFTGSVGMIFRLLGYFTQSSEFNYKRGIAKEKTFPTDDKASVFFLNTCFIGGGYPLTHGGVLPWRARVNQVADNILKQNSDIVCLSEVYDFKAAKTLYNKLKNQYSHFYLNVGPHHFAAKSGLFVASKYKIQNPHFIDFHDTLDHNKGSCRRGGFAFEAIDKENKAIVRVYSAHLEYSLNDSKPSAQEIKARKEEIDLIIKDIKSSKVFNMPVILTGDLNFSEKEYDKTDLIECFQKTTVSTNGTWRSDKFIKKLWNEKPNDKTGKEEESFDLDHTFILKKSPKDLIDQPNYVVETKIIPSFDEKAEILSALSDHHAMETTITLTS